MRIRAVRADGVHEQREHSVRVVPGLAATGYLAPSSRIDRVDVGPRRLSEAELDLQSGGESNLAICEWSPVDCPIETGVLPGQPLDPVLLFNEASRVREREDVDVRIRSWLAACPRTDQSDGGDVIVSSCPPLNALADRVELIAAGSWKHPLTGH